MKVISPLRKRLLRYAVILTGTILFLVTLLFVAGLVYGDKVKGLVVSEINRHLLVPVEIGEIEFTLIRSFPDAAVVFKNVEIKPSKLLPDAPGLLHANRIALKFSIFSLMTNNYKIRSLEINRSSIALWIGPEGNNNFQIWKKGNKGTDAAVNFDLQRVHFRNSECYFRSIPANADIALAIPDFTLRGMMGQQQHSLLINGKFIANRFLFDKKDYALTSLATIEASVQVNEISGILSVKKARLNLDGIHTLIAGSIGYGKKANFLNVTLSAQDVAIKQLIHTLPLFLTESYKNLEPDGRLTVEAKIAGKWDDRKFPSLDVNFSIHNGTLAHRESGARITKIEVKGRFDYNQSYGPDKLEVQQFSGLTRNGRIGGKLILENFQQPMLDLSMKASLELSDVAGFMSLNKVSNLEGNLLADVHYKGNMFDGLHMAELASGQLSLTNTGFRMKDSGLEFADINGRFELKSGKVYVEGLDFTAGESQLSITGFFDNLARWAMLKNQPLYFDASLKARKLRLEDLMAMVAAENDSATEASIFPQNLGFKTKFVIDELSYRKFTAQKLSGNLNLEDNVLRAENLVFKAVDGQITANMLLNGRYGDHAGFICNARLTDVDISRMFYEFNDFGQTKLQSRHIHGRGDATLQYASVLNTKFETDAASVSAVADVEIRDGELIKFEPMQALSRFLDEEDLKSVKISTLRNRIEITQKTIVIPEMEVKSSALNLQGYGAHTFGNDIDYHFSVLMSDLRKNKRRKNIPPPASIEEDGLGQTRLFLHMTGTVDNPVIKYDPKAVVKKIANDFKQEKYELREAIRREFSPGKLKPENVKPKNQVQFEIEWDEDK
ncbi:MAG: hypothetical protein M9948_06855 [Lentimicrobium sp.]|nr:hypothetical protein [Lentimicrobium sp.]